ncbi:MAG TPA: nuclear transport factor 2 family protein [Longimicrobium sp.]|jgi:ketosteroid isomerase-like protein
MTAASRAERFVDALYALEDGRDVEPLVTLHGDDADISNPLAPHRHTGPEGAREFWESYRGTFDSVRSEFHHTEDAGDASFLEWTSTGRTTQGRDFSYRGVSVVEWSGDRIRAFRTYFDPRHLSQQIAPAA